MKTWDAVYQEWQTDDGQIHAQRMGLLIRCKDCKHQRKEYHEDKRRKAGGYNIYWCDLVDGYAPLGFDDEYCAWAERRTDEID